MSSREAPFTILGSLTRKRRSISIFFSLFDISNPLVIAGETPCDAERHATSRRAEPFFELARRLFFQLTLRTIKTRRRAGRQVVPVPYHLRLGAIEPYRQSRRRQFNGLDPPDPTTTIAHSLDDLVVAQSTRLPLGQRLRERDLNPVGRGAQPPHSGNASAKRHPKRDPTDYQLGGRFGEPPTIAAQIRSGSPNDSIEDARADDSVGPDRVVILGLF